MNNICLKCGGSMHLNQDKDLSCLICGAVLVLTVRRASDITGIRKKVAPETKWRMSSKGMQRRKGSPRKFLGG
jgi:hypothetical protein